MPRDGAGNYTLPAGNPVATGTIIATTWANPTMSDIGNELTDSLSRTGKGGMLSPFLNVDGTIIAPGISWANEPSTGFYRPNASEMRVSINGIDQFRWTPGFAQVWNAANTIWNTVTNVGENFAIAGNWTFNANVTFNTGVVTFNNGISLTGPALFADGTGGSPSIAWASSPSTGLYRPGASQIGFTTAGSQKLLITTTRITSTLQFQVPDGVEGTPSYAFANKTSSGLFLPSINSVGMSVNGVEIQRWLSGLAELRTGASLRVYSGNNLVSGTINRVDASLVITTSDALPVRFTAPVEIRANNSFSIMSGSNNAFRTTQASGSLIDTFVGITDWTISGLVGNMTFGSSATGIILGFTGTAGRTLGFYHSGTVKFELTKTSAGTFRLRRYVTGGTGPEDVFLVPNASSDVTFVGKIFAESFESTSSRALKENFRALPRRDIMALQPQMYDRKRGRRDELGLILEDVKKAYPELCSETGIDYSRLAVVLLKEVQDLKRTLH